MFPVEMDYENMNLFEQLRIGLEDSIAYSKHYGDLPMSKKQIRANFRSSCFDRDGHKCAMCGETDDLAAHHITDRSEMPGGGYVVENGITVCADCHIIAEQFHINGTTLPGFTPDELYKRINSSKEIAIKAASENLKCQ